ncbi:MAG: DUF4956 domain-containing protein [Xanthomonadales bacterium]|nr:DUF4956 domain-containing protein [Xanthomonadales bacterium]NIN59094.1 DUF4956 domain-containing protein [Xanthomonadales bacterium]NIN74405.1 DUF4956 domain-containing protein [Xanthomonadales bacterium]NIO13208.1 DUF4956 domain-containing protein [Xanthomonadales bacterium]NIP11487.1 DUF4956 domain-containing protein [Xanthomonadales bacterium]
MKALRLLIRLSAYYLVLALLLWVAYAQVPDLHRHLPLGVVETLLSESDPTGLAGVEIHASNVTTEFGGVLWLVVAILGAIVLMVPVSWVYMAIRQKSKLDQSLLETMIILPVAVTGIVMIVHNSLALAFSLTGVVAGVRFRNALKNTADSVFIFMAVGVGLAAGIGMLMIAGIMTLIFNYAFLTLWALNYGATEEAKAYMRPSHEEPKEEDKGIFD